MNRVRQAAVIAALFVLASCAKETAEEAPAAPAATETPAAQPPKQPTPDHPMRPLWGDTHLHTSNSFDAFAGYNRLGPEEALRFARGEEVTTAAGGKARLDRPLDFLVITDHSNFLGAMRDLYETPSEEIDDPQLRRWRDMMHGGPDEGRKALQEILAAAAEGTVPEAADPEQLKQAMTRVWDEHLSIVERYNEPGRFSALVGFEYSLAPGANTLHRNVIFRDGKERAGAILPLPADQKAGPERLWAYMERYEEKTGGRVLAIPHNGNTSNGQMFMMTGADGGPMTADAARRRAAREPLFEATQIKGDSESHPILSPTDEFADFGDAGWDEGNAQLTVLKTPDMLAGEYAREALKRGLAIERLVGVNPYRLGLIGSTDAHTSLSTADDANFWGKMPAGEPNHKRMASITHQGAGKVRYGWQYQASGYAAVWARDNTREEIFDAMLRREVYASTGPRITVRFFGGRDFSAADFGGDWVKAGYERGAPMGGALPSVDRAPTFLVYALKDPDGANLDRIQVIKGWVDEGGATQEKIYDVAWSEPERRRIENGKLTPVGDTVDLTTATYQNTIGAPELKAAWTDPDFSPGERAFYYARVLEIPTPRWTAYDAVRFKVEPPAGARLKDQERAYTSPIWRDLP